MKAMILAGLVATTATAHATGWNENLGLELGVSAGTEGGMTHEATSASAELALSPLWRIHAQVARGQTESQPMDSLYLSGRVGAEVRICATEHVCILPGLDFGLTLQDSVAGQHPGSDAWFPPLHQLVSDTLVVVPRLRLDAGNAHWHFRPGVEASHTPSIGKSGVAGTAAVAYTW